MGRNIDLAAGIFGEIMLKFRSCSALEQMRVLHQPAGNYIAGYRRMEAAYKAGRVRPIGLSSFGKEQVRKILSICQVRPAVLQTEVHPYYQKNAMKEFL